MFRGAQMRSQVELVVFQRDTKASLSEVAGVTGVTGPSSSMTLGLPPRGRGAHGGPKLDSGRGGLEAVDEEATEEQEREIALPSASLSHFQQQQQQQQQEVPGATRPTALSLGSIAPPSWGIDSLATPGRDGLRGGASRDSPREVSTPRSRPSSRVSRCVRGGVCGRVGLCGDCRGYVRLDWDAMAVAGGRKQTDHMGLPHHLSISPHIWFRVPHLLAQVAGRAPHDSQRAAR